MTLVDSPLYAWVLLPLLIFGARILDVTLGTVVKDHDDLVRVRDDLGRILAHG